MKKIIFLTFFLLVHISRLAWSEEEPVLHLYAWVEYIPKSILEKFEKETGIRVIYDVYDSNDVLEAKLLTGTSRYDIVCPSAWPYVGPQIQANIYTPLDRSKLTNFKHLDPFLLKKLDEIDPGNQFIVPYCWGGVGIGFNKKQVKACAPEAPLDSWALLFDKNIVKKLAKCGFSLLDEAVDVIPVVLHYLGMDPNSEKEEDIQKAANLLAEIAPYVSRYGAFQSGNDLSSGELCAVQGWSSELLRAKETAEAAQNGVEIEFVIPREGASMWLDVFGIPKGAPHPDNAHKFLNFVLRPEIAAQIVNEIATATGVKSAYPLIAKKITQNPAIFPPENVRKKLFSDRVMPAEFARYRSRVWFDVRSGRHRNAQSSSIEKE